MAAGTDGLHGPVDDAAIAGVPFDRQRPIEARVQRFMDLAEGGGGRTTSRR